MKKINFNLVSIIFTIGGGILSAIGAGAGLIVANAKAEAKAEAVTTKWLAENFKGAEC